MSLFIASLNSGSNGNCYYIGNETEAILVDAGISCREIEKRMKRLNLSMEIVKGVFISHEHSDHINGIPTLAKKYKLPIYITRITLAHSGLNLKKDQLIPFEAFETIVIGELTIMPFPKLHDAMDPYSFTISCRAINVGVYTDIGAPCQNLVSQFSKCHAAFLEANYDEQMLESGTYPLHLKKRIRGGNGHLSNKLALDLFLTHKSPFLSHLFLSHLSKNNNAPELVKELFNAHANGVNIVIASRYEETAVYHITHSAQPKQLQPPQVVVSQLTFSFS